MSNCTGLDCIDSNALRYIAGYVIRYLQIKLKNVRTYIFLCLMQNKIGTDYNIEAVQNTLPETPPTLKLLIREGLCM